MIKIIYSVLAFLIDKIEDVLMVNPNVLTFIVKTFNGNSLTFLSKIKAIDIFHKSSQLVPAYKNFLKEKKINPNSIKNYSDFINKVPQTDKENYIYIYPIIERCFNGELPVSGNIDESAGSSGRATMWVRSTKEEEKLHKLVNFGMHYTFNSFKKNNLIVLNCWSTGPWATGVKFSQLAQDSTVVKCIGTNKKNAVETIEILGTKNEYLLCGYPPFIKEILDYGDSIKFDWNKYRINILTGGEGFSEGWRDYIRAKITGSNGEIYSAYGASDIDIGIGFETALTIQIKRLIESDNDFKTLILSDDKIPTFFGIYNPLIYHLENFYPTNEILFTVVNPHVCSPKIRYNLKDSGRVFSYNEIKNKILNSKYKNRFNFKNNLKLPFFIIYGRSDGTISLDGANIYPNDVQNSLFKSKFAKNINSFIINVDYLKDKSMVFKVLIELIEGKSKERFSEEEINDIKIDLRDSLVNNNKDYKESWENNPDSLEPRIEIVEYNSGEFVKNKNRIKNIYYKQ